MDRKLILACAGGMDTGFKGVFPAQRLNPRKLQTPAASAMWKKEVKAATKENRAPSLVVMSFENPRQVYVRVACTHG